MTQLVKTKHQVIFEDFQPLRGSSNKKTLYSTRSCVNWAFFGTRWPLKCSTLAKKKQTFYTRTHVMSCFSPP
jgi:hypothetical protein